MLKSHLIVEYALTEFIRCSSVTLIDVEKMRFGFVQKLNIAVLNGIDVGDMVQSFTILNQARNQVAHRMTFDRKLINDLISYNSENIDPKKLTDRQCITCLRHICRYWCGLISGIIFGMVVATE